MPLVAPPAQDNPFRITPNLRFVYAGQLDEAIAGARAAVAAGRDAAIVAEPGMGKTLALRLLARAHEDMFDVRFAAAGPGFDADPLFAPTGRAATLILLDDAHALPATELRAIWDRVRALRAGRRQVSLILAGWLRLEPAAAEAELTLDRFFVSGLPPAEAPALVRRRLAQAGMAADALSGEALEELARRSRGVPRLLNLACSNALFRAQSEGASQATLEHARAAAEALELPEPQAEPEWRAGEVPATTIVDQAGFAMDRGSRRERLGSRALASGLTLFLTGLAGLALLAARAPAVEGPSSVSPATAAPRIAPATAWEPPEGPASGPSFRTVRYSAFDPAAEGAARRAAAALAAALGVEAPEVRAVRARLSTTSVRYFHPADRDVAARANEAVANALRRSGFAQTRVQDLTHHEPRPQEGALEVWIGRDRAPAPVRREPRSLRAAPGAFEPVREFP